MSQIGQQRSVEGSAAASGLPLTADMEKSGGFDAMGQAPKFETPCPEPATPRKN
jgi:hypothetical protein